ncbi:MAG: hypothetical protein HQ581_06455, partial [Planctomycetes bacterium]|nr:hypothetical protein [Planctomycetota bacterium]
MKKLLAGSFVIVQTVVLMVLFAGDVLAAPAPGPKGDIAWEKFLKRNDIVWEILPQRFDHGAFHGNGLLGCIIYKDAPNRIRWEIGRSDV